MADINHDLALYSPVWKNLKIAKGKTKTNGLKVKDNRFYEWDHTHGDIGVYDARGKHLGSMGGTMGEMTKPARSGRSIDL
jgi:Cytotoxic